MKLEAVDRHNVAGLGKLWMERHITPHYAHPEVVERVIRRHINPVIGKLPVEEVRPVHIDDVLTRIVMAGAPTVANDALRYLFRMFHFAVKRKWIETNPAYGFEISDAGGTETPRERWLNRQELSALAEAMRTTENFGRINELATWLLLALCVRKMELLSAKWAEMDLEVGIWYLHPSRTKRKLSIEIPLAPQVIVWLNEVKVFASGSEYLFPARRLVRKKEGKERRNRFDHISPDTNSIATQEVVAALNTELKSLDVHELKAAMKAETAKGKTQYKLVLEMPGSMAAKDILSEGEQRAIAIAAFLAEVNLGGGLGGVVFDDPVSSLDHRRRWHVARRLAQEALKRQVIVFTHDC
jgi:integrase